MIYYSKISKDIYDPLMDIVREATNAGIKIRFQLNSYLIS